MTFAFSHWRLTALVLLLLPHAASAMTLLEAVDRASKHDARVPISRAISRGDAERAALDRASLLPQLSLNAAVAENDQEISSVFFGTLQESWMDNRWSVELRQAVLRWDMRSRWNRTELRQALAITDEQLRIQDFLTRVIDRYCRVLETQADLAFAQAEVQALQREQDTVVDRQSVGLATLTAVRETQARFALAQANLLLAEDAKQQAEDALIELVGLPLPALQPLPEQLPVLPKPAADLAEFIRRSETSALAVRQAQLQLDIARSEVVSAKAEAAPQLDLVGSYRDEDSADFTLGQEVQASRIALELNVPLYAGGGARKALRAAQADVDSLDSQLELALRQARQEAQNAWRAVDTQYRRMHALATAQEAAELALAATEDGLDAGTRTQLDVLEARSARLSAQRDATLARYAALRALARQEAAAGDLREDDINRFQTLFQPAS